MASRETTSAFLSLLEAVDLPLRRRLETRNRRIEHVYFPDSGFASVVANGAGDRQIEVGLIGREGMTGMAIMMGRIAVRMKPTSNMPAEAGA